MQTGTRLVVRSMIATLRRFYQLQQNSAPRFVAKPRSDGLVTP